jgi:threonine/homoserine/homoserine lactone efflux protein
MQIGNEVDGATLTQNQAVRRWIAVGGWISVAQIINPVPLLGALVGLAGFGYVVYLLYTTWQSPTKQGYHDHFAHTMVVKATRSVG